MWEPQSQSQGKLVTSLMSERFLPIRPEKRPSVSKAWEDASGRTSLLGLKGVLVFWCLVLLSCWCCSGVPGLVASWLVCLFPFPGAFCTKRHKRSPKASEQAEQRF